MPGERASRRRRWAGAGVVGLLVLGAAFFGYRAYVDATRPPLQKALAFTPPESERFAWTDWDLVRDELGSSVSGDSSASEVDELLAEAYDADLTSTTAMGESAEVLVGSFGISPANVSWELLAQSTTGSVLSLGVPHEFSFDDLAERLDDLGYEEPDDETGVWVGGDELIASVADGSTVSPQFSHWALDRDNHLVLASDDEGYLADAVAAVAEEAGGEPVRDVAKPLDRPLSAVLLTADQACRSLAMSQADEVDQATADELLDAAGEVNPLTGFALGVQAGGDVLAALSFETEEQARTNADTRAVLASGPAPGQGGDFADRFTLGEVTADGTVVTMDLEPVDGAFVLSDLSSGPVLFATC